MNIVLIGYRGTGKSVVGRLVARYLNMTYVSMDGRIVKKAGMSIPEIVEQQGWTAFRDMESRLAMELAEWDNCVIDTGGGIIERPENIDALRVNALIVWLRASVATIVSRIKGDTERPSLTGGKSFTDEVAEVLKRRTPIYASVGQYALDTDRLTPEQTAQKIVAVWEKKARRVQTAGPGDSALYSD